MHFAVLSNHLHLVVEADDRQALTKGMQGFGIRLGKRLNRLHGCKGSLLRERYHARQLRSPNEVRWALGYVLLNARKHAWQGARKQLAKDWLDPFSSAPTFDGWTHGTWSHQLGLGPAVTAEPSFWSLRTGWRRGGALDPNAIPGARAGPEPS